MVHARTIAGKTYSFIVSGKLRRNSLIMQDRETGTLWSHVTGRALSGKLAGRELDTVPSVQTTWKKWAKAHPKTLVLKKAEKVSASHYQDYFDDLKRMGIIRTHLQLKKLPGKTLVQGLRLGDHAIAVPDSMLVAGEERTLRLGSVSIIMAREADGGVRAYLLQEKGGGGAELPVREAFWFAWLSFFPNTEVFE